MTQCLLIERLSGETHRRESAMSSMRRYDVTDFLL